MLAFVFSLAFFGSIYPASGLAQSSLSNQESADKVAASLATNFPRCDLTVSYKKGHVKIFGNVASESTARDIIDHVLNIKGVTVISVENCLKVAGRSVGFFPSYLNKRSIYQVSGGVQPSLSNQAAADKIAQSLAARFPRYDIIVSYRNGQLELQGEVGSAAMAREVVEYVRNIDGVTVNSVENHLHVGRRGAGFIPANPNNTNNAINSLPPRNNIIPSRPAPTLTPDTFANLNEAARPEIANPNPLTGRRYEGRETSPLAVAPVPMPTPSPTPSRIDDRTLLIATSEREPDYSNILAPNPNSTLGNERNNYDDNFTDDENNVPLNNNVPVPNYNNYNYNNNRSSAMRPAYRPAVSAPLPLYSPPANYNNNRNYGVTYVANNPNNPNPNNAYTQAPPSYGAVPAPAYGNTPYYGATGPMPSAYNQPYLPQYAWPTYASYPNYAQVSYPRSYSMQAWPYIGPFYPYPQAPLGWRQVTLKYDHARWWLDFNDGEPSGPLSPLFRQPTGYRY
jgi:osmotically-inducible protein OsmY